VRMTTVWRAVAGVVGAAAMVSGCTGAPDGAGAPAPSGSPAPAERPTAVGEAISPLRSIEGADRRTVHGVGFDVPEGMEVREVETGNPGELLVRVGEPGATRSAVTLTVTDSTNDEWAVDSAVDARSYIAQVEIAGTQEWSDFERFEVPWEGMSYAVAFTMVSTASTDDPGREAIMVVARNEAKDDLVWVSAEASEGPVEDSVGYEILRTVRFEE
jgi:hypothetical protein